VATAPVNAPFSWPKSSDSSRLSAIAAQLIGSKGISHRGLWSWIARATSSFPVPLSPRMRTFIRVWATMWIFRITSFIFLESAMILPTPCFRSLSSRRRRICLSFFSSSTFLLRSLDALKTAARNCGIPTGLRR